MRLIFLCALGAAIALAGCGGQSPSAPAPTSAARSPIASPPPGAPSSPGEPAAEAPTEEAEAPRPPTPTLSGGLAVANAAEAPLQRCQALAANFPEDRQRVQGTDVGVSLVYVLNDRFHAADLAMQVVRDAPTMEVAQCGAKATIDVLVGPSGRHTSSNSFAPGMLPADRAQLSDPGIALAIYDTSRSDQVKSQISNGALGDASKWREPQKRWDELDAAVGRGNSAVAALDSPLMRLIGWALLVQKTSDVSAANAIGANGVRDAQSGFAATKSAIDLVCADAQDARCAS